jgi:hypothetical protein
MNVEIGAEAALFTEQAHINGIFVAVNWLQDRRGQGSPPGCMAEEAKDDLLAA